MANEQPKLNIYQKLQKVRFELSQIDLKKSGKAVTKDGILRYEYFELGDFMPHITKLCFEHGLTPKFNFSLENAILSIVDNDDPESNLSFEMPVKIPSILMCNDMQNIGGAKTFAKRYLYFDAFEINETETLDGSEPDQEAIEGNKKIDKAAVMVIKKILKETGADEAKFLEWIGAPKVEDIKNKNLGICMKKLREKEKEVQLENKEKSIQQNEEKEIIPSNIDF
ncbi:ERF family protein [Clostridium saccharoperbutylacetonicum]|uniref:ERF family protein n=1 Tax=Clostridium saccharoperbutylacetonicum TaxID=36745 RepID=UPI000983FA2A|nr:ERF family protein [Clostridium saccharoperbutylacetonicum]AQR95526.1 ERF superfamily protein [Clostridium saccharoperbutylacetonicum]NSB31386.1 hypothetical protein [Clostridium saccharoperbutylacetonicum]